ncbi:NusG domain II-containing protein [Acetonema longum]|nr:NusG domain II-containing protein [Acetonema longum]
MIFLAGIWGSIFVLRTPVSNTVEIAQEGTVLYRLNLSQIQETQTLRITGHGGSNIVLIENGQIRISHADCPDQTCVKMGWMKTKTLPIVCLPHRLVIRYTEEPGVNVDGATR